MVLAVEESKIILSLDLTGQIHWTDLQWICWQLFLILNTEVKMVQVQIMIDNSAHSPAFQDLSFQEEIRGRARFGLAHNDYMIGTYW